MPDALKETPDLGEVERKLQPYLQVTATSESKDAFFFHGTWRGKEAYHNALRELDHDTDGLDVRIQKQNEKGMVRVSKSGAGGDQPKYWLHALLFFLTICTTLFAGAFMEGVIPWPDLSQLVHGVPFSATLLIILGTHELGHYVMARYHNVDATLPYFIPAPTFIGTFGAFIKMKSPIVHKRALMDIGAAGPIAGFIMTIPALFIGLEMSTVVEIASVEGSIHLGDNLIMMLATQIMFPNLGAGQEVMLSPIAFAAWIGLLVTALNLLPIGQLDGGHIAYAMFGKRHKWIARIAFAAMIPLSFFSINWLVWALLILIIIRVQHPPILEEQTPLPPFQRVIGWISLAIFVGSFIPAPISM